MLSFAEELILLSLDDRKGTFLPMSLMSFESALAGSILMELALSNKIDTDLEHLILIDDTPTGDPIYDDILHMIKEHPDDKNALYWVKEIRNRYSNLREVLTQRLVDKGFLEEKKRKILGLFPQKRYPVLNDSEEISIRQRIRQIVLSDEIPEPKDIVIISLIKSCGLTDQIFSSKEIKQASERIYQISKMDLIGQSVSKAINELQAMINSAVSFGVIRA
ncbi:MAG: GPP34 family phosphoprotein [Candidatus Cloacimonetes bacterium]|nr:GPP34 family phosphoprotein [Candidatus Cloacimonadota bacterium]